MNKTESVSIGRRGFVCEQDAYKVLQSYLSRSEKTLQGDPDCKEILADLELSMAGHLMELSGDLVVDGDTAKKVVELMGEVEGVAENIPQSSEQEPSETQGSLSDRALEMIKKPLYKDHERAVADGVCAGIAKQLGVDPVWVRLLFILLLFVTQGFMIVVYILLAIVMNDEPNKKKRTATEVVDEFKDKLTNSMPNRRPYEQLLRRVVVGTAMIVWTTLRIAVATILVVTAIGVASVFFMLDSPEVVDILGGNIGWLEYLFVASVGLVLLIPLYELLAAMMRPRQPRTKTTLVLWSVWALSLIIGVSSGMNVIPKTYEYIKRENPKSRFIYMQKVGNDVASLCVSPLGTCDDNQQILTYEKLCGIDVVLYNKDDRPVWLARGWTSKMQSFEYPLPSTDYCNRVQEIAAIYGASKVMFAQQTLNDLAYVSDERIVHDQSVPNTATPSGRPYWHMEYLTKY